ncbi:MAG: FHA domain-containing protein [Acidimicrobiales bacterium]
MSEAGASTQVIRFGMFEANPRTGELRRKGLKVRLQDQPFQVLAMLLDRAGELVTREELRLKLWPDSVFVDFDHGLNKAVNKIRRALGESADNPRFVETLPRRGYRFIAAIEGVDRRPETARAGAFRVIWDSRTIVLAAGDNVIGRDEGAAVRIDSSTVSRRHARIRITGECASLEDLASKNGTFVGERRLDGPWSLKDGDEIRVGSARMVFRAAGTSGSTETR